MDDDRKVDALLRLHFQTDPGKLSDRARIRLWYDYLYARKQQRDFLLGILRQVVQEAFPAAK